MFINTFKPSLSVYRMEKGKVFIITGPSGVGKTEISKKILADANLNIKKVITCTTREKREGEIEGKDYFFLTKEQFAENLKNNNFFEHAEVYGNFYGSRKEDVEKILNSGNNVLFQIDPQGALNLKKRNSKCKVIFIVAESLEENRRRLEGRHSDSALVINQRMKTAVEEIKLEENFDFIVTNRTGKINEAIAEIAEIILEQSKSLNN